MSISKFRLGIYSNALSFRFFLLLVILFNITKVDSAQACDIKPEIKIIDESLDQPTYYRPARSQESNEENLPFKNFINDTSKYIISQLNEMPECNSQVKLFFVYRPYIYLYREIITPFQLERQSSDTKYLNTPWVKVASGTSPKPYVHAAFIWNERQFFLDQALLSGARSQSEEIPLPILERNLYMYSKMYTDIERRASASLTGIELINRSVDRLFEDWQAKNEIPETLPLDLYWLYRYAQYRWGNPFSTSVPLLRTVQNTIDNTIASSESTYTDLVNALVDRSFSSVIDFISYGNILDLKDVFPVDNLSIKIK